MRVAPSERRSGRRRAPRVRRPSRPARGVRGGSPGPVHVLALEGSVGLDRRRAGRLASGRTGAGDRPGAGDARRGDPRRANGSSRSARHGARGPFARARPGRDGRRLDARLGDAGPPERARTAVVTAPLTATASRRQGRSLGPGHRARRRGRPRSAQVDRARSERPGPSRSDRPRALHDGDRPDSAAPSSRPGRSRSTTPVPEAGRRRGSLCLRPVRRRQKRRRSPASPGSQGRPNPRNRARDAARHPSIDGRRRRRDEDTASTRA